MIRSFISLAEYVSKLTIDFQNITSHVDAKIAYLIAFNFIWALSGKVWFHSPQVRAHTASVFEPYLIWIVEMNVNRAEMK